MTTDALKRCSAAIKAAMAEVLPIPGIAMEEARAQCESVCLQKPRAPGSGNSSGALPRHSCPEASEQIGTRFSGCP